MKHLAYTEKIAVMRILTDIVMADKRIDPRETAYLNEAAKELELGDTAQDDIEGMNSLLALAHISEMAQEDKEDLARMMGRMIIVDEDINYNEVRMYNVVNDFCHIEVRFDPDDYPEMSRS